MTASTNDAKRDERNHLARLRRQAAKLGFRISSDRGSYLLNYGAAGRSERMGTLGEVRHQLDAVRAVRLWMEAMQALIQLNELARANPAAVLEGRQDSFGLVDSLLIFALGVTECTGASSIDVAEHLRELADAHMDWAVS